MYTPRRHAASNAPPAWLLVALALCVAFILIVLFPRSDPAGQVTAATPSPSAAPSVPPTATPQPTPEPDYTQPVPESEAVDQEDWFSDAVFIGDSRTDGLHLFSGITAQADFLEHTGVTVYEILDDKPVIRKGEEKVSILTALSQKAYGKVYISLGVNELGYDNAQDFADAYGRLIDAIRSSQSDARVYVQAIIPVNAAKCEANDQPSYVTNEGIAAYNEALTAMAAEKKVLLVNVAEALVDETGEVPRELSADGVHFKTEGYALWLEYLTTHTGL